MKPQLVVLPLVAFASACREDAAGLPLPFDVTAETLGHYCQMELMDHDGPKGQIHLEGLPAPVFFGQVSDAIRYLGMPEQGFAIRVAYVQDMATAESWEIPGGWITVEDAVFVVGSDRLGGMGAPEYVPFSDEASALAFIEQHGGMLRAYDEIAALDPLADAASQPIDHQDVAARLSSLRAFGEDN